MKELTASEAAVMQIVIVHRSQMPCHVFSLTRYNSPAVPFAMLPPHCVGATHILRSYDAKAQGLLFQLNVIGH